MKYHLSDFTEVLDLLKMRDDPYDPTDTESAIEIFKYFEDKYGIQDIDDILIHSEEDVKVIMDKDPDDPVLSAMCSEHD